MEIDVIIPSMRPEGVRRALYSLSKGSLLPNAVSIVSNEVSNELSHYGLNVRVISFRSEAYPIGSLDVALRRNIGVWFSECSHVMTFDDDQVAPVGMVAAAEKLLERQPYFWGHYRYIDFAQHEVDALVAMEPQQGLSREHPANAWHAWLSCYGGLFGAQRKMLIEMGGFDLIYCGRHAGEDQNLGRRLARLLDRSERVFIHEPPFAWHPLHRLPWGKPAYSNLCPETHELIRSRRGEVQVEACAKCPYFRALDVELYRNQVVMCFDPSQIEVQIASLGH